ncbi:multisubstrate pseudouridine synthase 7 isoform X3 [Hevea brasiliensis]|uniref:multisubstrate pseudouridine synthase 7 isoform X3 n=1 Tax=Hevea brasiliensis TaxID=3981 RepID=UPI0025E2859D|nr:multisubstrate pseudouridine synthase 7 isoform X3 [Hevea brasiliensis]
MWWHNPVSLRCCSVVKPCPSSSCNSTYRKTAIAATPIVGCCLKTLMATAKMTTDESDVGIFCYISQLPGFRGILKQRYSDFIVNEVDKDGNVVHLTSLEVPSQIVEAVEEGEKKVSIQIGKSYASEIESFRSLAGDSDAERLEAFITQVTTESEDCRSISPILLSPNSDKANRTAMHNFFKEKFKFLVTDTVDGPDASLKCIRVRLKSGGHNNGGRNSKKRKDRGGQPFDCRGSNNWPEHLGKFLRFHLYKENKDTHEAIGLIGKMLGIKPRCFGFAGIKDKRSVSTQRVSVFKQHATRLAALNDRLIGIKVGNFCHVTEELLLGQLLGNRFTITLRGVVADSEDTIKRSADSLGRHGFINYFGLQRFGSGSMPTYLVGAALLRGEWKSAVSMILDPREGERDLVRKAREYYKESGDIEGTLKQLPPHLIAERAILQCMKKCPGNYLQALKAIPRTLRMMYVHSYQSYLWNHAASVRVQKYGSDQIVVGDLVYFKGDDTERETLGVNSECEVHSHDDVHDCSNSDETSGANLPEMKNTLVKAVTAEDISTGNYTIDDVILPMPGEFSITSITGNYRRVFQKPTDFEWELLSYTDGNIPLAVTDLDKIAKVKSKNLFKEEERANGKEDKNPYCTRQPMSFQNDIHLSTDYNETEGEREVVLAQVNSVCDSYSQGTQMALKLSFTLPASSYATIAIRELLKTSSVALHKTLNHFCSGGCIIPWSAIVDGQKLPNETDFITLQEEFCLESSSLFGIKNHIRIWITI